MKKMKKVWALILAVCLLVPQTVFATGEGGNSSYAEVEMQVNASVFDHGDVIEFAVDVDEDMDSCWGMYFNWVHESGSSCRVQKEILLRSKIKEA